MNIENNFKKYQNISNSKKNTSKTTTTIVISLLWGFFICNFLFLCLNFFKMPVWNFKNLLKINGFTILIWTTVTFFSALVSTYANKYLTGFKYKSKFMLLCISFTLSVMLLVMSNHIFLLLFSWLIMGLLMSQLIGIDSSWKEAKEALKLTRKYFLTGTFFLTIGLLILSFASNVFTVSELAIKTPNLPNYIVLIAAFCIIGAAVVQSAIFPFHKWLLSAMTAPTPASALMHAGFVNGSGILLALFSTVLFTSDTLTILFAIGGFTAIIAQFIKLLQVNVKQKLGCSTIAQMGFMIMQCGLGFFNAAVAHLILHGFYKAYLFLSSGEEIAQTKPTYSKKLKIKPFQIFLVLLFSAFGAYLFTTWTGKGAHLDSSVFLTLVVAITVGQATYSIVKEQSLSIIEKIIVPPILFIVGIGVYALMYNGVTILMADMPMTNQPIALSWVQIIFGFTFLIGFFVMRLEVYKKIPWLYIKLMNLSQPSKKTVLMYKKSSI